MFTIVIAILLQILGFFIIYVILRSRIDRTADPGTAIQKMREELNSIMVEINRATEQNVGILEDKIGQLGELVRQADKKLSLLRREEEKQGISEQILKRAQSSLQNLPPEEKTQSKVLRLYREGHTAEDIAGRVGTSLGEVELIISLESRKNRNH